MKEGEDDEEEEEGEGRQSDITGQGGMKGNRGAGAEKEE